MSKSTGIGVQSRMHEFVNNIGWENIEILPYGANIADKQSNVLRAALQNVRGVSHQPDNVALEEIDAMDNFGIDLLGMTEINIPMNLDRKLQLISFWLKISHIDYENKK
jgi:hypothetical protein